MATQIATRPESNQTLEKKIQRARELLLATDLPVYAVAERCGFSSPHYFSRAFAARAGVPPGRYRESTRLG